jgi:hypothetical protein
MGTLKKPITFFRIGRGISAPGSVLLFVFFSVLLSPLTLKSYCQPKNVSLAKSNILQSFNFGDVQLLPGLMYDEFIEIKDYFMNLSNDDMLHALRIKGGNPNPPGKVIGGWYDELNALTLPQWISSYCRIYAITGEEECREKAEYLFDEWWKWYKLIDNRGDNDKWIITLLDMYNYCGRKDALDKLYIYILGRSTDIVKPAWDESPFKPKAIRDTLDTSRQFGDNSSEWYTAGWPLYLTYIQTGREEYKDLANFWEYKEWWDMFATQPVKPFSKTPVAGLNSEFCHAYSHINSFNAAAEAYRVKGDVYYLDAMKNLYNWMQDYQVFATGGFGPELEHIMPMARIVRTLKTRTDHYETQCDSWAALMLCQNLITLTGEAKYGNWIERLAYNAINATIPMSPGTEVMYYSNYNMNGATKLNRPIAGTCCAGTRPLTVIQYYINTYFHDNDNIYINLFTPSTVTWKHDRRVVKLTQSTDFPYSDKAEFVVSVKNTEQFGIGIRIPEWITSPAMSARVNGIDIEGIIKNGWFTINRSWKDGDKLSVIMPMDFWLSVLDRSEARPTAVMYGPLVMAFTTPDLTLRTSRYNTWWSYEGFLQTNPDKNLLDVIDLRNIKEQVRPAGNKLEFQLSGSIMLKPFMNYHEGELYYMYLDR